MTEKAESIGTAERTPDAVARVTLADVERGEVTRYLEPGDSFSIPTDHVDVEVFDA